MFDIVSQNTKENILEIDLMQCFCACNSSKRVPPLFGYQRPLMIFTASYLSESFES